MIVYVCGGGAEREGYYPLFRKGSSKQNLVDSLVVSILGYNLFPCSGALVLFQDCGSRG